MYHICIFRVVVEVVVHLFAVKYILQKLHIIPFDEHKYTCLHNQTKNTKQKGKIIKEIILKCKQADHLDPSHLAIVT